MYQNNVLYNKQAKTTTFVTPKQKLLLGLLAVLTSINILNNLSYVFDSTSTLFTDSSTYNNHKY